MARARDIGEPSYSPPRTLLPALQLSSNGDNSFFDYIRTPRRSTLPLCQPLFHYRAADLRLCDDISGEFQLTASIPGRSNLSNRKVAATRLMKEIPPHIST